MTHIRFEPIDFSLILSEQNMLKMKEGSVKGSLFMASKDSEVSNLIEASTMLYNNNMAVIIALSKLTEAFATNGRLSPAEVYIKSSLEKITDLLINTKLLADNGFSEYGKLSDAQRVTKQLAKGAK